MPVLFDYKCESCGKIETDVPVPDGNHPHRCLCGTQMDIIWQRRNTPYIGIHPKSRSVIWYNPATGRRATPGRNDVPMPQRYRDAGYERREFTTLRELDAYCKTENLVNEQTEYDSNGRGYDDVDHIYPEERT